MAHCFEHIQVSAKVADSRGKVVFLPQMQKTETERIGSSTSVVLDLFILTWPTFNMSEGKTIADAHGNSPDGDEVSF